MADGIRQQDSINIIYLNKLFGGDEAGTLRLGAGPELAKGDVRHGRDVCRRPGRVLGGVLLRSLQKVA